MTAPQRVACAARSLFGDRHQAVDELGSDDAAMRHVLRVSEQWAGRSAATFRLPRGRGRASSRRQARHRIDSGAGSLAIMMSSRRRSDPGARVSEGDW
jgi:hypothetical protein